MIRAFLAEENPHGPPLRSALPFVQRMMARNQRVSLVDADKCR
jgi:hypothetical protein